MLLFLYMMTGLTLYCLLDDIMHYILYSKTCHPTRISPEWDSFFIVLHWILSDQIWMYPVILFFWPTRSTKKRESAYDDCKDLWESHSSMSKRSKRTSRTSINTTSDITYDESILDTVPHQFSPKVNARIEAAFLGFSPKASEHEEKSAALLS